MHQKYSLSLTVDSSNNQVAIYTAGVSQLEWRESGQLPQTRYDVPAVMVDNVLYVIGGHDTDANVDLTSILSWDPTNESWESAGNLTVARWNHAAVVVSSSLIEYGCSPTT